MKSNYKIELSGDYVAECYYYDISDLYKPHKAISEVIDLKYSKLLNLIISGIFVLKEYGDDFLIIQPDSPQLKATNTKSENIVGRLYGDVFPIYKEIGFVDMLKHVSETDDVINIRAVTSFNGKITQIFNHKIFKDEDYFFISSDDIKNNEILKETEERVFNNPTIGICDLNINENHIRVNDVFSNFVGYNEEELNKLSFNDFILEYNNYDSKIKSYEECINKYINREILSSHEEIKIRKKDGSVGWLKIDSNISNFDDMVVRFNSIDIKIFPFLIPVLILE